MQKLEEEEAQLLDQILGNRGLRRFDEGEIEGGWV